MTGVAAEGGATVPLGLAVEATRVGGATGVRTIPGFRVT